MEAIIDRPTPGRPDRRGPGRERQHGAWAWRRPQAKSYDQIPVSGQDGDPANLNNVALGWQYVDVWKNSNELGKAAGEAALQLCAGAAIADVTLPDGLHRSVGGAGQPDSAPTSRPRGWTACRTPVTRTSSSRSSSSRHRSRPRP